MDGYKFLNKSDEFLANYLKENLGKKTLPVQAEELYQLGYRVSPQKLTLNGTQLCAFRSNELKLWERNTKRRRRLEAEVGI